MPLIQYIQFTDPSGYPPLEHSGHQLADQGWDVEFIGITAAGDAKSLVMDRHPNIAHKLLKRSSSRLGTRLDYLRFLSKCRSEILSCKPDVIYCSDVRSYPIGLWGAEKRDLITVLHEHDAPSNHRGMINDRLIKIRSRFARKSSLNILPQTERGELFKNATGAEDVRIVYNAPIKSEVQARESKGENDQFTLWYHGSIGPGQLPATIIDALPLLPEDIVCKIAGYETVSSKGYVQSLLSKAEALGVGNRIEYLGTFPTRNDLLKAASEADVGLTLFPRQFREPMVGASNKPFDYLACGLPLLMNDTQEWTGFFGDGETGIACNPEDHQDIARAIRSLYEDRALWKEMADRGQQMILDRCNYETQFQPIADILADLVCRKGGPR